MQFKFRDINNYTYEYETHKAKSYDDVFNEMRNSYALLCVRLIDKKQVYLIVDKIKEVEIE